MVIQWKDLNRILISIFAKYNHIISKITYHFIKHLHIHLIAIKNQLAMLNQSSNKSPKTDIITVNIDNQSYEIDVNPKWHLSNIIAGYIRNQYFSEDTKIEQINAYIGQQRIDVKQQTFKSIREKWENLKKDDNNNSRQSKQNLVIRLIEKCDDPKENKKPNNRDPIIENLDIIHQEKNRVDALTNQQQQASEVQIKKYSEEITNHTFNQTSEDISSYRYSYDKGHSLRMHERKEILVGNSPKQIDITEFKRNIKKLYEDIKNMMQVFKKQFQQYINFPQFSRLVDSPSYPLDELMQKFLDPIRIFLNKQIKGKSTLNNQTWNNRIFETDNDEVVQQKIASASNKIQNFILKTQTFQNQLSCDTQQHLIRQLRNLTLKSVSSVCPLFVINAIEDNNLKFQSFYNMLENVKGRENILAILHYKTKNQVENLAVFNPDGIQYRKMKQIQHRNNSAKKVKNIDKFGFFLDLKREKKYVGERGSLITLSFKSIEFVEGLFNLQCSNNYNISVKTRPKKLDENNREFWSFISNQTNPLTSLELYQIIFQSPKT